MGFNSVYQNLKEVFPQVDARILKAVAIEYSKDLDGAVESILTEVLPFISDQSSVPNPAVGNNGKAVETTSQGSSMPGSIAGEYTNGSDMLNDGHGLNNNSVDLNETFDDSLASSFHDAKDTVDQLSENIQHEELISFTQFQESQLEVGQGKKFDATSTSLTGDCSKDGGSQGSGNHVGEAFVPCDDYEHTGVLVNKTSAASAMSNIVENGEADVSLSNAQNRHLDNGYSSFDLNTTLNLDGDEVKAFLECGIPTEQDSASLKDQNQDALSSGTYLSDGENQAMSSYVDADFIQESNAADEVSANDETVLSTIVTRSGQICRINLLEDIIEDAKNYKDTLFSTMESITRLIKEVEHGEKAAQEAKEAATRGGSEILEKVEELKMMLKHAKEANDMHAGEVYGEKSILATEVRELQTRLLGLSDEKDKSLTILDEMRKTLEERLNVAEEERREAEKQLFEKKEIARGALAEQELIMEKVVEESKLLQQEAEENAKLRDFLMDKGRVVDTLQGEISVICQDVKVLKENFDNHVSLSKFPSFKQTSCSLASSTSSMKSMSSIPALGQKELLDSPSRKSQTTSVECQTPRSSIDDEGMQGTATRLKEAFDDDWELFDFEKDLCMPQKSL